MAKKLFTTYRAPVDSFPVGEQNVGLLKPGRYNGFDSMITRGALDISLTHKGVVKKTKKDNTYAQNYGVILFGSGLILHDEDEIQLRVDSNSGNGNVRVDYVIVENTYQEITGGAPPIYSIIKGPSNGTEPMLSNPAKQILIGKIYIAANGYLFTELTYVPERVPLIGDMTYDMLITIINNAVNVPNADTTRRGIVQQSTQVEVNEGTNNDKYVTPQGLHSKKASTAAEGIAQFASDTEMTEGTAANRMISAKQFRGNDRKKPLTSSYTLKASDVGTVFIGMGTNIIDVYIPAGLPANIWWGFISVTCNIRINSSGGGVSVIVAPNKTAETKALNSSILVESVSQNTYVVLGSLKNS